MSELPKMPNLGDRWMLYLATSGQRKDQRIVRGPDVPTGGVEVMPVAEHEDAVATKRQAFEVAEGGRKLWMSRALIYEDALRRIIDADPAALDALRIASKALGDATEYENTGRVAFESPLARVGLPSSPKSGSS